MKSMIRAIVVTGILLLAPIAAHAAQAALLERLGAGTGPDLVAFCCQSFNNGTGIAGACTAVTPSSAAASKCPNVYYDCGGAFQCIPSVGAPASGPSLKDCECGAFAGLGVPVSAAQ